MFSVLTLMNIFNFYWWHNWRQID